MRAPATGILALAALAAALPAVALGASAGVQDDRLPVTRPSGLQARVNLLTTTGAKVTRVDLYWSTAAPTRPAAPTDPNDPAYDWTWADTIFGTLDAAGITPIVTVWNPPVWAAGRSTGAPRNWNANAPKNAKDFANFMQALATRYNGRTNILRQGPLTVKFFEIWNEPNLQFYFRPQYKYTYKGKKGKNGKKITTPVSPGKYAQMVNLSTPAIKKVNPGAIVLAGVTGPKGKSNATGRGTLDWIADLKKAGMKNFTAYSQHIYPASSPNAITRAIPSWSTLPTVIKAVNTLPGGKSKKIYITESSYTTAKTPYRTVAFTPAQQATYLTEIYKLPLVKSSRIPLVMWFQLQDNPDWPGGLYTSPAAAARPWLGMFRATTAKPSLAAFRAAAAANPPKGNLRP